MHDRQVLCSRGWHMAIEAKPEPITIDTAQTAVIVVDMQNDFCSKGGLFDRAGVNLSAVQKGVGQPYSAPDGRQGRFLIRDTWNTDVIEELRPQPEDVVLYKHRFSGFYQTELDQILRSLRIKNLIFTGCTTSVCVESTIRDAMFRDYRCVLLADCVGEPIGNDLGRSNHEASLLTIQTLFGWVSDSQRFESALQASPLGTESD